MLDELAHWIALGLANLVNILDPEVIVIGGGLVEAADLLLPEVRTRFADLVHGGRAPPGGADRAGGARRAGRCHRGCAALAQ